MIVDAQWNFAEMTDERRQALLRSADFDDFVATKPLAANEDNDFNARKYTLLTTSTRDNDKRVPRAWFKLQRTVPEVSRDDFVLRLFHAIDKRYFTRIDSKDHLHDTYAFFAEDVFRWLLRRYDIRRARAVLLADGVRGLLARLCVNANILLMLWVLTVAALVTLQWLQGYWILAALAFGYATAVIVPGLASEPEHGSHRFLAATMALVPRLAASVAIGALFLVTEVHVTQTLIAANATAPLLFALAAVIGYLWLELAERIRPRGLRADVAGRVLVLVATGIAHSVSAVLVLAPYLQNLPVDEGTVTGTLGASDIFTLAGVLLSVGVLINVIWADEPVTAPL